MHKTIIWHVADSGSFPLEVHQRGNFQLSVREVRIAALGDQALESGVFHVFLIQCQAGTAGEFRGQLARLRQLGDFPKLVVVSSAEYAAVAADYGLVPRTYLVDDSIRPRNLLLILELLLQQEYYRQVVYGLSGDMRKNTDIFENMISLARRELSDARAESGAYRSLVEYEQSRRKFQERIEEAQQEVGTLRDQELLGLKAQLAATDRLSEFRDRELREARETIHATEAVLEFSRREQLRRENMLNAMDRLRSFTETELLELFQENQELRRKLGMPPRDHG